jgi:hypothetical protein
MIDTPGAPAPPLQVDDLPWLLTPRQVAYLLDITIPEVHRLARRGTLRWRSAIGARWIETASVRELHGVRRLRRALREAA